MFRTTRLAHFAAYALIATAHIPHAGTPSDWIVIAAHAVLSALVLIESKRHGRDHK